MELSLNSAYIADVNPTFRLVYRFWARFREVLCLAAAVFGGSLSVPSVASERTDATKDTVIQEAAYELILPGSWTKEPSTDPKLFNYRAAIGQQFLTVSVDWFENRLNDDEQLGTAERLVDLRRKAEQNAPGLTAVTLTPTLHGESEGALAARWSGREPARNRRFHTLLLCSPQGFAVFYYEAVGVGEKEAAETARRIMNSMHLARKFEGSPVSATNPTSGG